MFHPLSIDALRQDRERGALRNCTCIVKSGQSGPRALPSRWDLCSTPSFLTMPCTSLYFPHDVLQHRAFLLDVVFRQCRPVFGLLSFENRSLLVGMNAFLFLDPAFTLSMVSLAFGIERSCLAGQRLDEDLHATMQCVLLGIGGDGRSRLHEGLRSCLRVSPTPSASCRSEHLPPSGTPLGHSVPSMFYLLNGSAIWAR